MKHYDISNVDKVTIIKKKTLVRQGQSPTITDTHSTRTRIMLNCFKSVQSVG